MYAAKKSEVGICPEWLHGEAICETSGDENRPRIGERDFREAKREVVEVAYLTRQRGDIVVNVLVRPRDLAHRQSLQESFAN